MKKILGIIILFLSVTTVGAQSLIERLDSVVTLKHTKTISKQVKTKVVVYKKKKGRKRRRRMTVTRYVTRRSIVTVGYTLGCSVYDLTADSMLYSCNGTKKLTPASTQKLFVAITALEKLGIDYKYHTDMYIDGKVCKDSLDRQYLDGNVYFYGSYDPTISRDDYHYFASKLFEQDIDSLGGTMYASIMTKPIQKFLPQMYKILKEDSLAFSSAKPYRVSFSYSPTMKKIGTRETDMKEVLTRAMKRSKNDYAESMLLNLYNVRDTLNWSYEKCKDEVRAMVNRAAGNSSDYIIIDGSGLSHRNKCTPELEIAILRYAYQHKNIFEPLYESLPIAGVDGTISKRMKRSEVYDNVRAKTGTVNGVSTLAGYVTASNGHKLAFSIMFNDITDKALAHSIQDNICLELAR